MAQLQIVLRDPDGFHQLNVDDDYKIPILGDGFVTFWSNDHNALMVHSRTIQSVRLVIPKES